MCCLCIRSLLAATIVQSTMSTHDHSYHTEDSEEEHSEKNEIYSNLEEVEEEEKQQQQKGPHSATSISSIRSNEADAFSISQVSAQGSRIIAPFSDIPPKQAFDWWHKINYLNKVFWATKVLRHKNAEAKEEFCKKIADAEREYLVMTRNRAAYQQERSNPNFRSKTTVNGRTFYTPNKGRKSDRPRLEIVPNVSGPGQWG